MTPSLVDAALLRAIPLALITLVGCSEEQDQSAQPSLADIRGTTIAPRPPPASPLPEPGGSGGDLNEPSSGPDAGVGGAPAGGDAGGATGMTAREYCDAVELVFIPRCGGGSCHNRPNATIADFAVGPEEAASYVDVPSVRNTACGLIIDSSDPAESLIYRKLVGDFEAPMCGGFMPVSGGDLSDEQINCVASWVQQFAR